MRCFLGSCESCFALQRRDGNASQVVERSRCILDRQACHFFELMVCAYVYSTDANNELYPMQRVKKRRNR